MNKILTSRPRFHYYASMSLSLITAHLVISFTVMCIYIQYCPIHMYGHMYSYYTIIRSSIRSSLIKKVSFIVVNV